MAHYAEVNSENIVQRVIVVPNAVESSGEAAGAAWCSALLGGRWVKTSYNARENGYRGKFASPGDRWDAEREEFVREITEGSDANDANG